MEYVLVTGVSTGIGFDIVRYLTLKGYHVLGSVRKDADVTKLTTTFPNNFTCLQFDVTKKEEILNALPVVKQVLNGHPLAGLVNNAGLASGGPMQLMDDDKFRYQMEVNLFGVRNVTNIFLPLLGADKAFKGKPGKIVMISSISGIFNTPFNGAYCVSKHAVESMAEVYRRELMLYGIDVVSIQPGPIQSDLWEKNIGKYEEFYDTDYKNLMINAEKVMQGAERQALPAETISRLVHKILTKKKSKLAYIVNKYWLPTVLFVKYMPARWADKLLWRSMQS